jgi:hypothetical protein
MQSDLKVYDESALLERLTTGIQKSRQGAIFLVGSALTAPVVEGAAGVPNVKGVIELIRQEFSIEQQAEFDTELSVYQSAFSFLIGRRGHAPACGSLIRH